MRRNANDGGMTLLECLLYVALLGVVMNVSLTTYVGATRLTGLEMAALDRMTMVEDFREVFTRTVREAQGVVSGVGAYKTGPRQLVLEMPPPADQPGARRYAAFFPVYSPKKRLARLEVIEQGGQYTTTFYTTYALPIKAVRFGFGPGAPEQARLVSLDLDLRNAGNRPGRPPVTYRFLAALRSRSGGATP